MWNGSILEEPILPGSQKNSKQNSPLQYKQSKLAKTLKKKENTAAALPLCESEIQTINTTALIEDSTNEQGSRTVRRKKNYRVDKPLPRGKGFGEKEWLSDEHIEAALVLLRQFDSSGWRFCIIWIAVDTPKLSRMHKDQYGHRFSLTAGLKMGTGLWLPPAFHSTKLIQCSCMIVYLSCLTILFWRPSLG